MNYEEIKEQGQQKIDETLKKYGVFFAFSNKQFQESKTPLQEGDQYCRIMGGGFVALSKRKQLFEELEELTKWEAQEIKNNNQEEAHILYELYNHECFYMCDPSGSFDSLPMYTEAQIYAVYRKNREEANKYS